LYGRRVHPPPLRTGLALNLNDAYRDPRFDPRFDEKSGYRTRSLLAVPIISPEGKVVGVVEALNKKLGPFGIEDERLLEAITGQISVALKNAFLFEQLKDKAARLERTQMDLQRRVGELDMLSALEHAMGTATSESDILNIVVKKVREILVADAVSIALVEPKLTALRFHAATGVGEAQTLGSTLPLDTGLIGSAVATRAMMEPLPPTTRWALTSVRAIGRNGRTRCEVEPGGSLSTALAGRSRTSTPPLAAPSSGR